jgi:hypothetical protein
LEIQKKKKFIFILILAISIVGGSFFHQPASIFTCSLLSFFKMLVKTDKTKMKKDEKLK